MNCFCLINPVSGRSKGRNIFESVLPILKKGGVKIKKYVSNEMGEIESIAEHWDLRDFDGVIIVGGDGSVNEFVNGMMKRKDGLKLPLGIIPAGTGNSLLHDLNLLDPLSAAEKILKFQTRKIDLMKLDCSSGTFYAFNVIGWGLPSTINQKSEKWKQFGGQRYNIASIQEIIRNPNWPVEIELHPVATESTHHIKGEYSFFLACNTIHTGKGMKIAPKAKLDDGLVDIVMLRSASRIQLIQLFTKIFKGQHLGNPKVSYYQVGEFSIKESQPSKLIIDGQIAGNTPFSVKVLPKVLEILN